MFTSCPFRSKYHRSWQPFGPLFLDGFVNGVVLVGAAQENLKEWNIQIAKHRAEINQTIHLTEFRHLIVKLTVNQGLEKIHYLPALRRAQ